MAGMSRSVCIVLTVTVLVAWVVPHGEAIGCSDVAKNLYPCIPYLTNKGPLGGCCSGVHSLYNMAKTPADRKTACNCLKSLAGSYKVDSAKASGLPGQCGVSISYKISPNIDCSRVH